MPPSPRRRLKGTAERRKKRRKERRHKSCFTLLVCGTYVCLSVGWEGEKDGTLVEEMLCSQLSQMISNGGGGWNLFYDTRTLYHKDISVFHEHLQSTVHILWFGLQSIRIKRVNGVTFVK